MSCDDNYVDVVLLLHLDGTDGAAVITDSAPIPNNSWVGSPTWGGHTRTAAAKYGSAGLGGITQSNNVGALYNTEPFAGAYELPGDFCREGWIRIITSGGVGAAGIPAAHPAYLSFQYDGSFPLAFYVNNGVTVNDAIVTAKLFNAVGSTPALTLTYGFVHGDVYHHYALTREGSTVRMFVDGILVASGSLGGPLNSPTGGWQLVGAGDATDSCYIDDVRWTLGVPRYTTNFTPPTAAFADTQCPPLIISQPQDETVDHGDTATFMVQAVGLGTLHYQWTKDGVNVGTDSNTYTTPATVIGDSGSLYAVTVTDDTGPTVSDNALLVVRVYITVQPQDVSVLDGHPASFEVVAVGKGTLHYQWLRNGVNVGTDSSTYTTPDTVSADNGTVYTVIVTDDYGYVISNEAILTVTEPCVDTMNCDCEAESPYATMAELRVRLMRRLGYSSSATNPPPGMTELLTDFLTSSQKILAMKNPSLRTTRIFKWTMVPGQRFYGLNDDESCCGVRLDPLRVKWVGVEDLNGHWTPLVQNIPPEFYTTVLQEGLPLHYEIRSCIEIFPAPSAAYTLRIKGDFGITAFVNPEHKPTLDDELVFLFALATAKTHYKQADAQAVQGLANTYLKDLIAGKHMTARYVATWRPLRPMVQPMMTHFENE